MLVCFALEAEAEAFRSIVANRRAVVILITGIGRINAEKALRATLKTFPPQRVLTCGFAGGLNPALARGEVIYETENDALRARLQAVGATPAKFFCAARIATTVAEKRELRRTTGADAVEMESAAIQEICRAHALPCATVRVISDPDDEDLPLDFNQLAKADLNLHYGKLVWAIAQSPTKIPALLRLRKHCQGAANRLAETLTKLI